VPGLELTLDYTHFVAKGFTEVEIEPLLLRSRHFHARGGASGRIQTSLRESTIDYDRVVDVLIDSGYDQYIAVEYVWNEWERMNEIDVLSETVIFRDWLRAKFAGKRSAHPTGGT
jgi:hypothetical protein